MDKGFGIASQDILVISVADAAVRVLKTLKTVSYGLASAYFSPDGRYIVYDAPPTRDTAERDIFVLVIDSGREWPLVESPGTDFVRGWAPGTNRILFARGERGVNGATRR